MCQMLQLLQPHQRPKCRVPNFSVKNATVAIRVGIPPFAITFIQLLCPSSDSDILRDFFSLNFHLVARWEEAKNDNKISNQIQCPSTPTVKPTKTAAATPELSSTLAFVEPTTNTTIIKHEIIKFPWLIPSVR